jgi:hypothetical protein
MALKQKEYITNLEDQKIKGRGTQKQRTIKVSSMLKGKVKSRLWSRSNSRESVTQAKSAGWMDFKSLGCLTMIHTNFVLGYKVTCLPCDCKY